MRSFRLCRLVIRSIPDSRCQYGNPTNFETTCKRSNTKTPDLSTRGFRVFRDKMPPAYGPGFNLIVLQKGQADGSNPSHDKPFSPYFQYGSDIMRFFDGEGHLLGPQNRYPIEQFRCRNSRKERKSSQILSLHKFEYPKGAV
jgi:hypothetical protein